MIIKYILHLTVLLFTINCFSQNLNKFDLANQKLSNGYYKEAIADFTDLIEKDDKDFNHLFYYGRAYSYYELGSRKLALKDLKKVFKVNDSLSGAKVTKGNSYWLKALIKAGGKPSNKSVKILKKATKYIETSLLYSTIGYDEIFLGKIDSGIEYLNKSIKLDSTNAWAYSNLALAFLRKGELAKAKTYIMKSISLQDDNPFDYKHSAQILIEIGDLEGACKDLQKAKSLKLSKRMTPTGFAEIEELIIKHCN